MGVGGPEGQSRPSHRAADQEGSWRDLRAFESGGAAKRFHQGFLHPLARAGKGRIEPEDLSAIREYCLPLPGLAWAESRALYRPSQGWDIVRYRDYLARKHSPSSVNLSLAAIQAGLSRAFDDGLVDVNEASRVPRLGDHPNRKQERRPFTEEELRAILEVCDTEWRGMVLCGAYTGMRLGDVCLLRWENIDLSSREIRFKAEKTDKPQAIPIAEPLFRHLMEIAGDDPRAPLFPRAHATRQRDIPTGTLSNQFYKLMTLAGIVPPRDHKSKGRGRDAARASTGLGFHCLRHTTTSLLKRAGVSDAVARTIVGHESEAVSRIYSHIDARTLRAAIEQLPDITE
jgi:integrase